MKIACYLAGTVLLTVSLELFYERRRAKRPKLDVDDWETMDKQINDGYQTSIRLIGFGILAAIVAVGIVTAIGL